jgi:hypothetical protein
MSAQAQWWLTLAGGLAVVLVVAVLLGLILASARRIRDTVAEIWVVGPGIAQHTAHLDLLRRINQVAGDILAAARGVAANAARIQEHADGCAGCPRCVTGWGSGGPT